MQFSQQVRVVTIACVTMLVSPAAPAATLDQAGTWQRWEHALTAGKSYANPYAEVDLQVEFLGPAGQRFSGRGFWDGGSTFRIRFAFPLTGTWKWRTTCSDPTDEGLHDQAGTVEVHPFTGDNALYRHGHLTVSENRRYLAHADGTPFLWIGDTAWLAYVRATEAQWTRFVEDRSQRGFSAVLTSVSVTASPADNADPEGNTPFEGRNAVRWNPTFWQGLDAKVQSANDRGLVVGLTGLGFGRMKSAAPRQVLVFARNLAARLAGNAVVYSARQDWGVGHEEMLEEIGQEIHCADPFALVTVHPRRLVGEGAIAPMPEQVLRHYYPLKSVDFVGVQTGPGAVPDRAPITLPEASRATLEWITALYRAEAHKPVVNLEGVYDDDFPHDTPGTATAMARRGAYLSFLSGACGFTSSSYGLWMWGKGPPFGKWRGPPPSVTSALDRPYATHLHHLATLFSRIQWWRLEPAGELIRNQPEAWHRRMALARTPQCDLAVAYLPDNDEIEIDLSGFASPMTGRWFDPIKGTFEPLSPFSTGTRHRFRRPPGWPEAVLLIETQSGA